MEHPYSYIGGFLRKQDYRRLLARCSAGTLARQIDAPHVTFVYRPEAVEEELFGEPLRLCVTGYANDGRNEGVRVEIRTENARLRDMAERIRCPHITLSVSEDGRPVDTGYLTFTPVEPFELTARFGGYDTRTGRAVTKPGSSGGAGGRNAGRK